MFDTTKTESKLAVCELFCFFFLFLKYIYAIY